MTKLLFVLLGFVLGAALGIALPVGFSLFMAWLDNFEPGVGAPTAFAIMLPFTVIAGAAAGAALGYRRASTGSWRGVLSPPTKKVFFQKFREPSPLNEVVVQELAFKARGPSDQAAYCGRPTFSRRPTDNTTRSLGVDRLSCN